MFAAKEPDRTPRSHAPAGHVCRWALIAIHVGLVFVEDGEVIWANPAATRLLGFAPGQDAVWLEIARLARRLSGSPRHDLPTVHPLGTLRAAGTRVRVCGVQLPVHVGSSKVVLVTLERHDRRASGDAEVLRRYALTPRELQIARLLAQGFTNAQVAIELDITPNTARSHTERVLRKLGVHSRAAVASALLRA